MSGALHGASSLWWLNTWAPTSRAPLWLCPHEAGLCVYCTWLFSENLHVHSSTKQARPVRPLLFTDEETEAWRREKIAGGPLGSQAELGPRAPWSQNTAWHLLTNSPSPPDFSAPQQGRVKE